MRRLTLLVFLALSISLSGCGVSQDKCAVVILTDQLKNSLAARGTVYVSINGADADQARLDALRPLAASIRPGSQMPHLAPGETARDSWWYSVSSIQHAQADRYTAMVDFYCGSLCGARIEYQLKKDGDSCAVIGQRILVQQ